MSLKIEDVKAGDELVCIDIAEFSKKWKDATGFEIKKMDNLSILHIYQYSFSLKGDFLIGDSAVDKIYPNFEDLKYFKKKEQSQQYTFDDLIDAAYKAYKDGVFIDFSADKEGFSCGVSDGVHHYYKKSEDILHCHKGNDAIERIDLAFDFIKSLYKETFVIESEEDLKRVKLNPKITLNNGEVIPFSFKSAVKDHLIFYDQPCGHNMIHFVFLKGATVEQERGCNE